MPRYNNDGRSAKFIHTGGGGGGGGGRGGEGGRGGGFQGQGQKVKFNDFKFHQKRGGIQKRDRGPKVFQRLDDGDVMMGGEPQAGSSGGFFRGNRHSKKDRKWRNKAKNMKHQEFIFGPSWHKVLILDGTCLSRDVILQQLMATSRIPFTPIAYTVVGTNTVFFVEDRPMAQALAECSGKISTGENQHLKLKISPCPSPPTANFDIQCETKVRGELERRYNGQIQTISLANFLMSPELIREYYLPLTRGSVVIKLLNLLEPMLTNLVGLDLSSNKLPGLDGFGALPKKAPNLKALNLGKNKFREIHVLDKIQGLQIIELILEENPICNNYTDQDKYISVRPRVSEKVGLVFTLVKAIFSKWSCAVIFGQTGGDKPMKPILFVRSDVRKRFPKVIKLDGVDIPAPITFEVTEPIRMPEVRGSSFCNEEAKKVVLQFWEQYMSLYDTDNRQPLMQAYHDTACMSMMASYTQAGHVSQTDPTKKLSVYLGDSRNLLRNPDKHRKYKQLRQGKLEIMAFLEKLPKSIHDPTSIVIDMPVAVESFILFNVVGLFKEREERHNPIRYFSRTFALVPLNQGFVIVNELLYITNATSEQVKGSFKPIAVAPAAAVAALPTTSSGAPATVTAPPRPATDQEKLVMLASFSQQSGMNDEWSRNCLEENEWDFNRSAFVFSQLKEQGKIPPEAFTK